MGRRSSIDRLPAAVRDKIGSLRQEGRTIDEIMAKLDELNVDVSRSAVGRHCKRLESIQASIRQSRTIAEAIVKDYGDEDKENKVARANIEVLHSILFRMMGSEDGEPVTLDAKDAMFLATSLEKLTKAEKTDFEKEMKLRDKIREKAEKNLEKTAQKKGFSKEVIETIRREILGGL